MSATAPMTIPNPAPKPAPSISAAASELQEYRKMVAELATAADGKVIVNRSESHAAVVIEYLFRSASQEINIVTGKLHAPIYGSPGVVEAAVDFFRAHPDGHMRIVSEEAIAPDHPLLSAVKPVSTNVKVHKMSSEMAGRTPFHFAIADAFSFRFEPDKRTYEAYGQFGEPKIGERLKATFDRLYASSSPQE